MGNSNGRLPFDNSVCFLPIQVLFVVLGFPYQAKKPDPYWTQY